MIPQNLNQMKLIYSNCIKEEMKAIQYLMDSKV